MDVRNDSVDGCAGRTRKHRFGCSGHLGPVVGGLGGLCLRVAYVVPQLLDVQPRCMLPSHWHRHFSKCLGRLKAVPVRQ